MFIWLIFTSVWAITATVVIVVLLARQSDALGFPELAGPVTAEERPLMEQVNEQESIIKDLRIRVKHAERERNDEAARLRIELWTERKVIRDAKRVLERGGEPGPELDPVPVTKCGEWVG